MLNIFSSLLFLLLLFSSNSGAQLIPIDEGELSNMTGQAFINLDRSSSGGLDFTKVSLGLDVKTSLNSDLLDVGNYTRDGSAGSDIRIKDFALGKIESDGTITPFEIKDPFVELAFENNGGKQDLVGVRLGFGGAKGALSGTIESLTGNVNINIKDTAAGLQSSGSFLGGLAAVLLSDAPLESKAQLVDSNGNINRVRSTQVGLPNGFELSIRANNFGQRAALNIINALPNTNCSERGGFLNIGCVQLDIAANNCQSLGIGVCFDLDKYNTLDVGKKKSDGTFDFAEGLFLGFQTKPIEWNDGGTITRTESGAFLNVPNGGLEVTLAQAFQGTARARTRYVDPYFGGF